MNAKRILIGILVLASMTLSGCFVPPPPGYYVGQGHGYAHRDSYYYRGYDRPYGNYRDHDDRHDDSGRGARHWR